MKRRLTVALLAITACVLGAYQTELYPASGQTPTPTSGPLGGISGRVYVDVDANGTFGGPDAPLEFPLELFLIDVSGPAFATMRSSNDGTYHFGDLPAGNYQLSINLPIASCVGFAAPFTWVGDRFFGLKGCNAQLTTSMRDITLAAGETAADVDFPQLPRSYDVTARIWLNAARLSGSAKVTIRAAGKDCWNAQINPSVTGVSVPVSFYLASLVPSSDPACQGGDLQVAIDGRPAGAPALWDDFWRESLLAFAPRPLHQSSDPFPYLNSTDLSVPGFLGISGQAIEAGTVTPQNVSQHQGALLADGTTVTAFVGTTLCGEARIRALRTAPSQAFPNGEFGGNLFGLIVPPASAKPGCGTPGAQITFCIGDFKARQPAAGPFSHFQSPEAKPVQWAAPALADITLEPTTEPCLGAAPTPTPAPGPDRIPTSLPATGGRQNLTSDD